ncbi:MAG TPA: hypothetical protein DD726_05185 [Phycisphaerales bacterium]|nr:hypothetical protein [Phycisphaerales bacterium]
MWVKFKKNYTGVQGMFTKDQRLDLPDATAKLFVNKKICITTCPPWDDGKDHKLAAKEALLQQEAKLGKQIESLTQQLADAQAAADKIPAIKDFLKELQPKHQAILKQLEPDKDEKGNDDEKTKSETHTAKAKSNAKGQTAKAPKA